MHAGGTDDLAETWHEVEEWLARSLLPATTLAHRRLIAHELRRQMPHLSGVAPPSIAASSSTPMSARANAALQQTVDLKIAQAALALLFDSRAAKLWR